ncbi:MAG: CHAP domain-containing protein [Oscillospiraceae bacterium]|nr:CHAP domain-containing protein [Oscillospiraceae bacterium]
MKEKLKSNEGATLIELLVTIVCCSVVTLAAVTLVFLGMGISTAAYDDAGERQTVRTVLTVLESAAEDGTIQSVRWYGDDWAVVDSSSNTLFQFKNSQKAITTGGGAVLLENVEDTTAKFEGKLLTISLTVDGTKYTTSVYCRMVDEEDNDASNSSKSLIGNDDVDSAESALAAAAESELVQLERQLFLVHLASQYGSTGKIEGNYDDAGKYYSQWYIGDDKFNNPEYGDWNADTAWCACYVSWALEQVSDYLDNTPKFAAVRAGWSEWTGAKYELESVGVEDESGSAYTPEAGDLIFFHWYDGETLDHVGVVFYVDGNSVYTIEGNSGGRVALHRYDLMDETDSSRIAGFAVLNWKTEVTENP